MDLEPITRPADQPDPPRPAEPRPEDQAGPDAEPAAEPGPQIRPEILAIFHARWERNEPAYRFLAEH